VVIADNLIFRRFTLGFARINGYLLAERESRQGVFIDPGGYNDLVASFIEEHQIELRHIFFTHGHIDHMAGLEEFRRRYAVRCCAGKEEVRAASRILHGGERIELAGFNFTALSTAGHTPGGISYYCRKVGVFTGDALFSGSVGGTGSALEGQLQLEQVRRNIFSLPDETLVFPGHGPLTTVAAERYGNPFFS